MTNRRALIALRLVLLVGWAALAFLASTEDDTWGTIIPVLLFVGSAVSLWATLRRTSPAKSPDTGA